MEIVMLEKFFKLKENGTNVRTEVVAGITTFMTMAYILAVNPSILSASGMDAQAVLIATAIASFIGTICMALLANYPFALAPGLGLNAYFAYTVCGSMGYSWQIALFAVFVEGLIFIVLSLTNVREAIFNAIPLQLKKGVSVGIGLFIAFIGLQNAGIVVNNDSTLVSIVDFTADFHTSGISALLAVIGIFIIAVLYVKKVKGAILIGIFATWILGIICQLTGLYVVTPDAGYYSLIPAWSSFNLGAISSVFGQCFKADFSSLRAFDFVAIVCAFLFVDIFDTLGTLIGCATKADMLDKEGKLPRIKEALLADAIATTAGAVLGTSTTTTFVESSAGVAEGGRTGLSSVVTGLLFLLAVFLSPIFITIPSFATAPALLFVGFLMISAVTAIDFNDFTEAVPAYLALIAMPLTYSISEGIAAGVISYVVINLISGKAKKITPLMYVLAVLFICKFIFL
jgi:AGZA family xanthine/uracil permease-like MFS transporter